MTRRWPISRTISSRFSPTRCPNVSCCSAISCRRVPARSPRSSAHASCSGEYGRERVHSRRAMITAGQSRSFSARPRESTSARSSSLRPRSIASIAASRSSSGTSSPGAAARTAGARHPHERRTTSSAGSVSTSGTSSPPIPASRSSTARRPSPANGIRTVVRGGGAALTLTARSTVLPASAGSTFSSPSAKWAVFGRSSNPTTATSSGTRSPRRRRPAMTACAKKSLGAAIASGRSSPSSSEAVAATGCRGSHQAGGGGTRSGAKGSPRPASASR